MMEDMSTQEQQLCVFLRDLPRIHKNRYKEAAENELLRNLFWSLAGGSSDYLRLFFPDHTRPLPNTSWKLRKAQGGADGEEFTEAARGKVCGHIFKSGEATYRCKTCSADDTCVLCSRCYDSSDHTGHMVYISVSLGNSGCCDCGDPEAWRVPVHCSIHTAFHDDKHKKGKGKDPTPPQDLTEAIRMTIGRVFDFICDVISCSPEQLRLHKSKKSILLDEQMSRLTSRFYGGDIVEESCEFALLLWNDEKHTVNDVRNQVARACKVSLSEGLQRAHETDNVGRTIVKYSYDVDELLKVSEIIEQIKITVTIRSARDTFREQMCGTIVEWLSDISGCSVGSDHDILRRVICEEMLKPWSTGSQASNADIGMNGIDDNEMEDPNQYQDYRLTLLERQEFILRAVATAANPESDSDDSEVFDLGEIDDGEEIILDSFHIFPSSENRTVTNGEDGTESDSNIEAGSLETDHQYPATGVSETDGDGDIEMGDPGTNSPMEDLEAIIAGYPPLPPVTATAPPPRIIRDREVTPSDSDTAEIQPLISSTLYSKSNPVPRTPHLSLKKETISRPPKYWLETPAGFIERDHVPLHEDLWNHLRLDWMILFDLRMWKKVRIGLRDLYISTVVSISEFKRILGLRFAGLYTTLAQLYLIADREPDHSIINISLQMLTTPSITSEIVERGNFLTKLMAILYTFLTTRQVGHPYEINPNATLAFDSGSVTNRRMYHFFMDLRYLFGSEYIQKILSVESRYTMQFLDLVKLHQGICPNVRAIGEHVEYETDAWISASLITREINRLCRQFSESFKRYPGENYSCIIKAIRTTAKAVIFNSLGAERKRFSQNEIKEEIKFKKVGDYEFEFIENSSNGVQHSVVKFDLRCQPISFHHALHYTLSWLIEYGKNMTRGQLIEILSFRSNDLFEKPRAMGQRSMTSRNLSPEDNLMAAFDYPLRVCAWLAQMKASMWVRNGMSLRHQMSTYRGVNQRDVSHHRDIFLLQTAMVVCPPSRVLASAIDRFGLEYWMKGIYEQQSYGIEDTQVLDAVEDLIHLLIVLISDRTSIVSSKDEPFSHALGMRRDIIHVLCFKPLPFSDICNKLPDKFQDKEECQNILEGMTIFKPPEGLSDVGTFELKEEFSEEIDPYISHYNKNQREESENVYKTWMAKKTGQPISEIVFEPKLPEIQYGAFSDLAAFTRTGIFAQIIYYSLLYALKSQELTPSVAITRVEAFLQVVLHLVLIAISEDKTNENHASQESNQSFVHIALTRPARSNFLRNAPNSRTIASILEILSRKEEFKACHSKNFLILKRMQQKRPSTFEIAFALVGIPTDRISNVSSANSNALVDREKKKQAALARQAKVMAQFQQQQKNFLDNQTDINWGEEEISENNLGIEEADDQKSSWEHPSGTCILCQEETKDSRLYGTFALMTNSTIFRQTDFNDSDFIREVIYTPNSLDRSAENIRPFGVAGENHEKIKKIHANGAEIDSVRYSIGKGFPPHAKISGPVSVGCGHIMHYKCFAAYYAAAHRRHQHQIARHHPENLKLNEFVCPLCKALGNAFLPIIWSPKEKVPSAYFKSELSFEGWLDFTLAFPRRESIIRTDVNTQSSPAIDYFMKNNKKTLATQLATRMPELLLEAWSLNVPTIAFQYLSNTDFRFNPLIWANNANTWLSASNQQNSTAPPLSELVASYRRLTETMHRNKLPKSYSFSPHTQFPQDAIVEVEGSETLAKTLAFSISAVEIQQRGVASLPGTIFLEAIPQQALTHLRTLAESAASFVSISGIRAAGDNAIIKEFAAEYEHQLAQLFLFKRKRVSSMYLLRQDIFKFLTECSLCLVPMDNLEIIHVIHLCFLAEIVKVILNMGCHEGTIPSFKIWQMNAMVKYQSSKIDGSPFPGSNFQKLCCQVYEWTIYKEDWIINMHPQNNAVDQLNFDGEQSFQSFVRKYALVFLRKVALLLHVRYGASFNPPVASSLDADEVDRLMEVLHLPDFNQICAIENDTSLASLIKGWISQVPSLKYSTNGNILPISVSHPAIFELIGLPKNYDTLMEETMKRRCPTTGNDICDPILCLFCGVIICGQSVCCLKQGERGGQVMEIGGGQQHVEKCQKNIGLFLNIRKCCVFYVHNTSGSWIVAPYINKYGEVDPGLRHSRQLFLNQKRYDALLRAIWLNHGIPSVISRKLEMDINNGGWETI